MKKGLRRLYSLLDCSTSAFERGPDEEGIETNRNTSLPSSKFERGPDEEGIETIAAERILPTVQFERGPDEEGIETDFG